jgi:anaerobic selenocysteine-containing dehydrogenase
LYTPGTLLQQSIALLGPRVAQPLLWLHEEDAASLGVADGDRVTAPLNGRDVIATVSINGYARKGVALIRGVPYAPGTAVAQIEKVDESDE